jgi:hypothetical protein
MVRVLIVVFTLVERASACTAALAARGATADGSSLLLHTDDCLNCDFRIARVPPVPESEPTRVTKFREQFPRDVSTRSATYDPDSLGSRLPSSLLDTWRSREWAANQTLAVLDAIEPSVLAAVGATAPGGQTLGTLEGLYAIANTAQVALAETTCAALPSLWSPARTPRGTRREGALWDISALSRVALARCPTARCAIDLMGYLAVTEGFCARAPRRHSPRVSLVSPLSPLSSVFLSALSLRRSRRSGESGGGGAAELRSGGAEAELRSRRSGESGGAERAAELARSC